MTSRTGAGMKFRKQMARSSINADPVTPEVRAFVLERDRGCIAAKVEPEHVCRDQFGAYHPPTDRSRLTLDHIKDAPMAGKRAKSDPAHLVSLCWDAHLYSGWATSHRPELRAYLRAVAEHVHVEPVPGCAECYQAFG